MPIIYIIYPIILFLFSAIISLDSKSIQLVEPPNKFEIGYSVPIKKVKYDKMKHANTVGIKSIEMSGFSGLIDNYDFSIPKAEIEKLIEKAKIATKEAGINVRSIHMPFSKYMDISSLDENDRQKVITTHKELLKMLEPLNPEIILFHPSWLLEPPNKRQERIEQLIKSVNELNETVKSMGAILVIENMLGPELMVGKRERPLLRTVEETVDIFDKLPKDVYSCVDMNHIKNPEILIRALGSRIKALHVADGTGEAENHWFPCSNQGDNNWLEIFTALHEIGYSGAFTYECAYDDEKDLVDCFNVLHKHYIDSLSK